MQPTHGFLSNNNDPLRSFERNSKVNYDVGKRRVPGKSGSCIVDMLWKNWKRNVPKYCGREAVKPLSIAVCPRFLPCGPKTVGVDLENSKFYVQTKYGFV